MFVYHIWTFLLLLIEDNESNDYTCQSNKKRLSYWNISTRDSNSNDKQWTDKLICNQSTYKVEQYLYYANIINL